MKVEVVYALPGAQTVHRISLASGATVADALRAVSEIPPFAELLLEERPVGVFGERVDVDRLLLDGDRVEIYRKLAVDPKEARRLRAGTQNS
ncbi:MAG: RnfH family protein [Gammaproteobacteria bacterium]|nr:MAG: RnfH family protein [Gammaproteobacteria bacterium]